MIAIRFASTSRDLRESLFGRVAAPPSARHDPGVLPGDDVFSADFWLHDARAIDQLVGEERCS